MIGQDVIEAEAGGLGLGALMCEGLVGGGNPCVRESCHGNTCVR
jgi:hypothetical protein